MPSSILKNVQNDIGKYPACPPSSHHFCIVSINFRWAWVIVCDIPKWATSNTTLRRKNTVFSLLSTDEKYCVFTSEILSPRTRQLFSFPSVFWEHSLINCYTEEHMKERYNLGSWHSQYFSVHFKNINSETIKSGKTKFCPEIFEVNKLQFISLPLKVLKLSC